MLRICLSTLVLFCISMSNSYGQIVHQSTVTYSQPAAIAAPAAPCANPTNPCNGASNKPCNCDCKPCIDCDVKLSNCCVKRHCTPKPRAIHPIGTIPTIHCETSCYIFETKFEGEVKVPKIVCETRTCTEIAKRTYTCIEGCTFELCVPINDCEEKVIKCELRLQLMNIVAKRRDNNLWDVYVINDPNVASSKHAGGMPIEWVVLHCATFDKVKAMFPQGNYGLNTIPSDTKLASKTLKPLSTELELKVDEAKLNAQIKKTDVVESIPSAVAKATPAKVSSAQVAKMTSVLTKK